MSTTPTAPPEPSRVPPDLRPEYGMSISPGEALTKMRLVHRGGHVEYVELPPGGIQLLMRSGPPSPRRWGLTKLFNARSVEYKADLVEVSFVGEQENGEPEGTADAPTEARSAGLWPWRTLKDEDDADQ